MQLRIRAQNIDLPPETRRAIERRVRLGLGRHAAGIDRVQVTLSSSARVQGNQLNHCRIRVRLRQGESLAIEDHAEDLDAAAAVTTSRLEHRLDRQRATGTLATSESRRLGLR